MPRLDIGIGQEFPLEEKPRGEDCARGWCGHKHHDFRHRHHHGSLREMWQRRFGRDVAADQKKDKE